MTNFKRLVLFLSKDNNTDQVKVVLPECKKLCVEAWGWISSVSMSNLDTNM